MKVHGERGVLKVPLPANSLQNLFRVTSVDEVKNILRCFPNCETLSDNVSITVIWKNWEKYQVDTGYERLKRFRQKHAQNETVHDNVTNKRREEKRREEKSLQCAMVSVSVRKFNMRCEGNECVLKCEVLFYSSINTLRVVRLIA